jgi:hypothetical protein
MKEPVVSNIDFFGNVPKDLLKQQKWWIAWYKKSKPDGSTTKPPLTQRGHSVDKDYEGVTISEAWKDIDETIGRDSGGVGFLVTHKHDYVFFDFDHVMELEHLPRKLKDWLIAKDAYTERSPSGKGFRVVMECKEKHLFDKGQPKLLKELCGDGSLYLTSGYVTVTGDWVSGENIPEVTADELKQWFIPKKAEVIQMPVDFNSSIKHPDISLIGEALRMCKLDQSQRIQKVYKEIFNEEYDHYQYWLKILQACHHYGTKTGRVKDIASMVYEWSATDETDYVDEDDVFIHFDSMEEKSDKGIITYNTLFKFAELLKYQWPVEKFDNKGNPTGKPMHTDVVNMQYLMEEYFNLRFFEDIFGHSIYVTGDKSAIDKYFKSRMIVKEHFGMTGPFPLKVIEDIVVMIAQTNKYSGINAHNIKGTWKSSVSGKIEPVNTLKLWLDTPSDELPEDLIEHDTDKSISNIEGLMSCFEFTPGQNMELTKVQFDKFIHSMVMPVYNLENKFADRPFLFLLVGPEASRKSTFCSNLFPANLREQFVTNSSETLNGDKSYRDFKIMLVESALIAIDEADNMLKKDTGSKVKFLVTTPYVNIIPIYGKHSEKRIRTAAIIASTNKMNFTFEREGSRRLAIIKLDNIDTDKLDKINKHHLFRSIAIKGKEAFLKKKYLWHMSSEQTQLQYQENEKYRSKTNLEVDFDELFDDSIPPHNWTLIGPQGNKNLWILKEIRGLLMQKQVNYTMAGLVNELKRYCGAYTKTTNKHEAFGSLYSNYIASGVIKTNNNRTYYVLPPLREGDKSNYTF